MWEEFFQSVLKNRWTVVLITVLLVALSAAGIHKLSFSNDYRMFFGDDNPELQAFEQLQNTYTKNDNVLFVITPKDGRVFSNKTLTAIKELTHRAWQIPYSIRVDSVTNYQHTEAEEDDLRVGDLVENPGNLSAETLQHLKNVALAEPLLLHHLISSAADVAGVNVTVQLPGKALDEVPQAVEYVRQLQDEMLQKYPDLEIRLTGMIIMNNAFPEASQQDMKTLYPAMFVAVLLTLIILMRSFSAMLATLLVIVLVILGTMGLTGWRGVLLSPPTAIVPIIIMTLAVADCVHILIYWSQAASQNYAL
ncbi:MAG: MMPL family transporter [gamma proteobacterium symbiont of Bathyaustriella thionipta]|nr:MMPL family transporter [gamma proteobacterium symbiont of Bathyaustriella thionipta]